MKVHQRIESSNARHTRITLFIDGANCGQLTMLTRDVPEWFMILHHGASQTDEFVESGEFWEGEYE